MTALLDLMVENADVLTMDPSRPRARTIGVLFGQIVGLDEDLDGWQAREYLDAGGACVLPGLIDAHTHLELTGQALRAASITGCASIEDALQVIAEAAAQRPDADWLEIGGYDQAALGRHLTAAELDAASGGRKVWVRHISSHASVVSSAVLDANRSAAAPASGLLEERAQALVRDQRLPYPGTELAQAILAAAEQARAQGITFCMDAGNGGEIGSLSPVDGAAYLALHESGRLPVRMLLMPSADVLHDVRPHPDDGYRRGIDLGLRTGFGSDRLGIAAQKVVLDGGMQVSTARMSAPYGGSAERGVWRGDPDELCGAIVDGHCAGWQMAVHAIGDEAVDLAIRAFTEAQRIRPRPDARHRIEHGGVIRPDQLPALASLGLSVVTQPSFIYDFGDRYADQLGPERAAWLYRGRSLLEHGITAVGSTDRPLPGSPLRAVQALVERRTGSGQLVAPAERISVAEALGMFTVHGAWVAGMERRLGRIAPRQLADFCVLERDPTAVDADGIAEIPVLATAVDGAFHSL
jgi:predicted amidohydrolase YtcJ